MTAQELFESSLQDQSDLFQVMTQDLRNKIKEFPIKNIAIMLSENPNDLETPKNEGIKWVFLEIVPILQTHLHLSQKQALKTVASWIGAMGVTK